jgi:hypothetical protein
MAKMTAKAPDKKPVSEKPPKPSGKETSYVNPFRTCDDKGRPVNFRFSSAKSLRDVFNQAQQDDLEQSEIRAKILSMYEAKLPWSPQKLEAAGIKDKCNINWLGLKGQIDARAGAISDLALDTTDLVELRPATAELAGPDADDIGQVVADEFSMALRNGLEFLPALSTAVRECDLYGFGPLMWTDQEDYKPTPLLRGQIKLAQGASHLSSRNELIMVESVLPADYLFSLFDYPDVSESMGWNLAAVRKYLVAVFVSNEDTRSQSEDENGTSVLESQIAMLRQNRTFETRQFNDCNVIHAFVKETSGDRKITHYMIPAQNGRDEFLMVRQNAYDKMDECLQWIPYTITENKAKGLRGLASFIAPIEDINNRIICEMMDTARAALKTHLTREGGSTERLTMIEQGPYVVYPQGVGPAQNPQTAQSLPQVAGVVDMGAKKALSNATGAGASATNRVYSGADRKTKEEVMIGRDTDEKNQQSLFVLRSMVFDSIFRECFRRFMKIALSADRRKAYPEVQEFVDKCTARGVGLDKLRKIPELFKVYICRDLVIGGAGAKAGLLADVLGLGGNLDEKGRLDATHDYIRCRMGSLAARRYRPKIGRDSMPSDSASHALLENNDMLELSAVLAAPDQMHWSHIPTHGRLVQQIIEAVEGGQVQDPQRMLDTLQLVSEHIQAHIEYGGKQIGKEDAAKRALADLRALRPVQQALTMMAASADRVRRAEEEKQQREMEDLQARAEGKDNEVKIHEIDTKAALKMREQDLMHQARMAEADSKAQTDAFRARSKAEIDRISANYQRITKANNISVNAPPSTEGLVPEEIF